MNTNDIDNNRVDVAIKTGKRAEPERLLRGSVSLLSLSFASQSYSSTRTYSYVSYQHCAAMVWNLNATGGRCWCLLYLPFAPLNSAPSIRPVRGPRPARVPDRVAYILRTQVHSTCIVVRHARPVYYKHSSCTCCQSHLRLLGCAFTQRRSVQVGAAQ
jgi:hypothetical protein